MQHFIALQHMVNMERATQEMNDLKQEMPIDISSVQKKETEGPRQRRQLRRDGNRAKNGAG